MKYKVGDRVRIKSLDWYNENKNKHGEICFDNAVFVGGQSLYCGRELTICLVTYDSYYVIENDYYWTDEMIEGLVEEKCDYVQVGDISNPIQAKTSSACFHNGFCGYNDSEGNEISEWNLPEGYQFTDENGNVINATKIVLEKKKKEYPKTYTECCRVLGVSEFEYNHTGTKMWYKHKLMATLDNLMLCRDAYWKIAGKEMGLGKPWKPNYNSLETKYTIEVIENKVVVISTISENHILAFPTEEMRDAFYENFKKEIEFCKELL